MHTTFILLPLLNIPSFTNKLGPHWMIPFDPVATSQSFLICHVIICTTFINWAFHTHNSDAGQKILSMEEASVVFQEKMEKYDEFLKVVVRG